MSLVRRRFDLLLSASARWPGAGAQLAVLQVVHAELLHQYAGHPARRDHPVRDHGGPRAETPPPALGADTDAVLGELGLTSGEIAALRRDGVV